MGKDIEDFSHAGPGFHLRQSAVDRAVAEERERCAAMVEGFTADQIRMAAGEMTAQEMRSVKAVQRWWASAIRGSNR